MRFGFRVLSLIAGCICVSCSQTTKVTPEYIHAPVNLNITLVATQTYSLSFNTDNREGGFSGFGVFTGVTSAELNTDQPASNDKTAAPGFCDLSSAAFTPNTPTFAIQVGPAAAGLSTGASLCDLTGITLTTGSYVALRARVQRDTSAWSKPAIVQVP